MAVGATVNLCNSGAMKMRAHLSTLDAIFFKVKTTACSATSQLFQYLNKLMK